MQNLADFHFGGPGSTYVDTKEWSWKDPKWADPSQQEEGHAAKCYEALLLMQQPQHAALLIEGRLTPRMRAKLAHAAGGMKDNVELSLPDFKNFVPRDAREFNGDQGSVPGFELVPPEVLGTEVYKSFAHGYLKVFQAIDIILQVGRDLPTPSNIVHQLGGFRERYLSFFLEKHGQVEFALDAIIRSAEDGVVEMGSVSRSQTSSM